jgi:NAD(P)-dependent dehydrogenase (short-subunit alcohol dehydrogenase family)
MLIDQLGLNPGLMRGETVVITGAGGGIGFEAARALLWLGANVVIAEINETSGRQAEASLAKEFGLGRVLFILTDVGDETSVKNVYSSAVRQFGKVDAVINNATIAVLGLVKDLSIEQWDASYRVNLRGPVLMARAFLPDMIQRKHGTFVCVSSTGAAFLGGYETFKAAQVHLANTLDAELEGTGVNAFTIGPGLVPTQTASAAVNQLAPLMNMTVEEFFVLNKNAVLSVEEAGTGFALSVLFAERFKGMEISSLQALKAANIQYGGDESENSKDNLKSTQRIQAAEMCSQVLKTLHEQSDGWKKRSIFEREWVIRDFRKTAGMSVEEWLNALHTCEGALKGVGAIPLLPLSKLADYYRHLAELAKGYEKNAAKLQESLGYIHQWLDEVDRLQKILSGKS